MTTTYVAWSSVKSLVLAEGSRVEPKCKEAVRSAIPDKSTQQAEVGFPMATELLDIYRFRYQSIEGLRTSRYGWRGFFSALETTPGRVGLLAVRCSGWRFTILLNERMDAALACLCGPPSPEPNVETN
jgi:hypothetical protein